jgi:hypothetical protein
MVVSKRFIEKIANDACIDLAQHRPGRYAHPSVRAAILSKLELYAKAGTKDAEELRSLAFLVGIAAGHSMADHRQTGE